MSNYLMYMGIILFISGLSIVFMRIVIIPDYIFRVLVLVNYTVIFIACLGIGINGFVIFLYVIGLPIFISGINSRSRMFYIYNANYSEFINKLIGYIHQHNMEYESLDDKNIVIKVNENKSLRCKKTKFGVIEYDIRELKGLFEYDLFIKVVYEYKTGNNNRQFCLSSVFIALAGIIGVGFSLLL